MEKHFAEAEVKNEDEVVGNVKIVYPNKYHETEKKVNNYTKVGFNC